MSYLKLDWQVAIVEWLPALATCEPDARAAFVAADGDRPLNARALSGDDVDTLVRAGLAESAGKVPRIRRTETGRRVARLIVNALPRGDAAARYQPRDPRQHLVAALGADAAFALIGAKPPGYHANSTAPPGAWLDLTRPGWVTGLRAALKSAKAAKAFEAEHHRPVPETHGGERGPYFGVTAVRRCAAKLIDHLLAHPAPAPPQTLTEAAGDADAAVFDPAFEALLHYGVLYFRGGREAQDTELTAGLWPRVVRALSRPAADPPVSVPASDAGPAARPGWVLNDLNALLLTAAESPLRLKSSDNSFYAADEKRLQQAFLPPEREPRHLFEQQLGELTEGFGRYEHPAEFDERVHRAVFLANEQELTEYVESRNEPDALTLAGAGRDWLALPAAEQTRRVLRARRPRLLAGRSVGYMFLDGTGPGLANAIRPLLAERPDEMLSAFAAVFAAEPGDGPDDDRPLVPGAAAVRHHARHHNPLPAQRDQAVADKKRQSKRTWETKRALEMLKAADELALESAWTDLVERMCVDHLLPLGGLDLVGPTESGGPVLARLSPAGRVLLGLADPATLDVEAEHALDAGVLVQPNFEVVFLAPAPAAQATLAGIAERASASAAGGVGTLFRLTKKSIVAAAAAGRTADAILTDLTAAATRPVPENVAREVAGWANSVRRVSARTALVVETPDPDTARRVRAAAGKDATLAGDTTVVLNTPTLTAAVRAKLRKHGIVVHR